MESKADRPYGTFPRDNRAEPAGATTPARPRRWYEPAPGPRAARIRQMAFASSVVLLVLALVASVPGPGTRARVAGSPTPRPSLSAVYERVSPSVVEVQVRGTGVARRQGAGVVVDQTGAILTSLHIVRDAQVVVRFADGTESPAVLAGSLPEHDIALLLPYAVPPGLTPAVLGDPSRLSVGDEALVIGNPFGLTRSLSTGVISGLERTAQVPALERPLSGLIQFDAAVNPGNSGGPLLDRDGEVVGIVVGVVRPSDGGVAVGVGFAVTIDVAGGALGLPPD
jgi:putative serine protease PepD